MEPNGNKYPSIYKELLKSFSIVLLIFLIFSSIFAIKIIFTRLESNIENLSNRSLTIAWEEYESYPKQNLAILSYIAAQYEISDSNLTQTVELLEVLNNYDNIDFWCLMDSSGEIIANNFGKNTNNSFSKFLSSEFQNSLHDKNEILTTELIPNEYIREIDPSLANRASLTIKNNDKNEEHFDNSLFQITALPLEDKTNKIIRTLLVGRLINNNNSIAYNYSKQIPDSFLSISTGGVRVSTNLETDAQVDYIGSLQAHNLIDITESKNRFYGQVRVSPREIHLVASDPILNVHGEVIGALTVGVPSEGLASLKKDTFIYIGISALGCFLGALAISSIVSKRFSSPIKSLGEHAQNISEMKIISSDHIKLINSSKTPEIKELWYLQHYLNHMATSLYEKTQENERYLATLKKDKNKLQVLTFQLQQTNQLLEKKVEERTYHLRKAILELRELNNLKSKFLATMSHEIRTPLNSVIGFSEMLHDEIYGELNTTQKEYTQIILNSAHHLLDLINDILDLSLIEQNITNLNKQDINLASLIQSVETIIKHQILNNSLSFCKEIPDNLPNIYADPTRVKQILYNLLSNSIKFTPAGGSIILKVSHEENHIVIEVKDTGIGIKKEHLPFIFDEFYQIENIYERKFEGVGLGLPLTKRLVDLHNGHLQVKSTLNKGTDVFVFLPLDEPCLKETFLNNKDDG